MRIRAKQDFQSLVTDGREHQGIGATEEYFVLGITNEEYRVWNRHGEPVLYPKVLFEVIDTRIPAGWVFAEYDEGEYHLGPAPVSRTGFYEDYFCSEGDTVAQSQARKELREALLTMSRGADKDEGALIDAAIAQLDTR